MPPSLDQAGDFIWKNARLLDLAIFDYFFRGGSSDRVLSVLRAYQNEDGGFGYALEPDLRAPDSHPLFVEFGLRILYECSLRDPEIAYRACSFIAQHADLEKGIPTLLPSSQSYPRAEHWHHSGSLQPGMDRLVSLVGLVNWQGVRHPWLPGAVEACLQHITAGHCDDAHIIQHAFCLLESVSGERQVDELFDRLAHDLLVADFFILEAPVKSYGLTPLMFAPSPSSYCRPIFTDAQINAHLDDLYSQQQPDGGWPITWNPPEGIARMEWRAQRTVQALTTLRAYGRI